MLLGREQIHHPEYKMMEKLYIALLGMPIIGLRIRARNVFGLIPKKRKYRSILDAGSGPGVFTFELARRFPSANVLGVDLLKEQIAASNEIAAKVRIPNVSFMCGQVEDLPEKNFFDLILCVDILEHIENDLAVLKHLFDLLASGGSLILHVPAMYRRYPFWRKQLNFDVATHVRVGYEMGEIVQKVSEAGFEIVEKTYTYGFWETLANNISYMITKARMQRKVLYSVVFPFLNGISLMGRCAQPKTLGAGVCIVASK